MKQSTIIVSNLMIIFQLLAEHSELLSRSITAIGEKFSVKLWQRDGS
jgi:hypothetical protein